MEDTHIIVQLTDQPESIPDMNLFGVFDGHGGAEVAMFVRDNIKSTLLELESFKDERYEDALKECFMELDKKLKEKEEVHKQLLKYAEQEKEKEDKYLEESIPKDISKEDKEQLIIFKSIFDPRNLEDCNIAMFSGTTACVALVIRDQIYIANAGDSKCIVISSDKHEFKETILHSPKNEEEKKRIEQAEGTVDATGRINGVLGVSRSIGDLEYKQNDWLKPEDQMISAMPDIYTYKVKETDYIVIACDGVWNSKHPKDMTDDILKNWGEECENKFSEKISNLFEMILNDQQLLKEKKNMDNMTMLVVKLNKKYKEKEYEPRPKKTDKKGKNVKDKKAPAKVEEKKTEEVPKKEEKKPEEEIQKTEDKKKEEPPKEEPPKEEPPKEEPPKEEPPKEEPPKEEPPKEEPPKEEPPKEEPPKEEPPKEEPPKEEPPKEEPPKEEPPKEEPPKEEPPKEEPPKEEPPKEEPQPEEKKDELSAP